jgi:dTDP-4-dehydrorhamnose reductase
MVYTNQAVGPFTPSTPPDANNGYGYDKLQAEQQALRQNPQTVIARLGWQIGEQAGSNNMVDFLERQMREHGTIRASQRWYPACSFIADTAAALVALADFSGGVYLVNANIRWTFYEIVNALNELHQQRWQITPTTDFVYDQRMFDERVPITPLNQRLTTLT